MLDSDRLKTCAAEDWRWPDGEGGRTSEGRSENRSARRTSIYGEPTGSVADPKSDTIKCSNSGAFRNQRKAAATFTDIRLSFL